MANHLRIFALSGVLLAVILILSQSIEAKKCIEREKEMEVCAIRLEALTDDQFKFPKSIGDMKDFCERLSKNHDCISKYAKDCLSLIAKLMATPVLKNIKDSVEKKVCKNDDAKKDFIKRVSCGSDSNLVHFQRTVRAAIARLEHLNTKKHLSLRERAPFVCCSLRLFQDDIKSTTTQHCPNKQQAEDMSKFLIDLTQGAAGSLLDMFCSDYKLLSDCDKPDHVGKYLTELREITAKVKNGTMVPKSKAIIPLVFKLA